MRIVIAGGSGLLGHALTARLQHDGDTVVVLTRHPKRAFDMAWNPNAPSEPWAETVGSADAVINLAGESINGGRWTNARKAALFDSRVRSTRALARAIQAAAQKPLAFLSGSAIGLYGPRGDEPVTEETPPGSDFLSRLAVEWEREALTAARVTRVVLLRTGVVLAREGGALPQMALPFRFFAGGPIGSGGQGVSWIHIDDWVSMVRWALDRSSVTGPLTSQQRRVRSDARPRARASCLHPRAGACGAPRAWRDGRRRSERPVCGPRESAVARVRVRLSRARGSAEGDL
jgi:uncharacterized protein